jgi:hypothetical protein
MWAFFWGRKARRARSPAEDGALNGARKSPVESLGALWRLLGAAGVQVVLGMAQGVAFMRNRVMHLIQQNVTIQPNMAGKRQTSSAILYCCSNGIGSEPEEQTT